MEKLPISIVEENLEIADPSFDIVLEKGILEAVSRPFNQWLDARKKISDTEREIEEAKETIRHNGVLIMASINKITELKQTMFEKSQEVEALIGYSATELNTIEKGFLEKSKQTIHASPSG